MLMRWFFFFFKEIMNDCEVELLKIAYFKIESDTLFVDAKNDKDDTHTINTSSSLKKKNYNSHTCTQPKMTSTPNLSIGGKSLTN